MGMVKSVYSPLDLILQAQYAQLQQCRDHLYIPYSILAYVLKAGTRFNFLAVIIYSN
jgi:hypothetical protein